ncbi:unnamed protein product [Caretta caretta]
MRDVEVSMGGSELSLHKLFSPQTNKIYHLLCTPGWSAFGALSHHDHLGSSALWKLDRYLVIFSFIPGSLQSVELPWWKTGKPGQILKKRRVKFPLLVGERGQRKERPEHCTDLLGEHLVL